MIARQYFEAFLVQCLNTDRKAVHAHGFPGIEGILVKILWIAFHGYFGIRIKMLVHGA